MATFEDFLSEGKKLQIKRKYTENHPAKTVGKTANVRNAVLQAIKDGVVTREEFNKILSELSADSRQWSSRNRKYFNISEEGIKLSKWGMRILNELDSEEEEMILSDEVNEKVKITKDKWPYVEFKDGGKKYKVEFDDYEEIDDHGNEGKDVFFIGYDQDDNEWQVDVSVGYNYENSGEIQDIFWDTLQKVDESKVNEKDDAGDHLDKIADIVGGVRDFFAIGKGLDKGGYKGKYFYSDTMMPMYQVEIDGFKFGIINKKYVDKGDREVGNIAIGLMENMNTNMKNEFTLYESFGDFLSSNGILNEAINSAIFRSILMNGKEGKHAKKNMSALAKGFYGLAKVALDKIEDEDFIVSNDPGKVFKNYGGNSHVLFFISDNEKENPYYDTRNGSWNDYKQVPGGGILLAAMSGDRQFFSNEWSRWAGGRTWSKNKKGDEGQIGINHKYRGWGASGLNNGKRIAEVSDRVIVLNLELIKQKYSTEQLRNARAEAKAGATAFKSDKDFRDANNARYHKILADKAASLPLDKMVQDAIDTLAKQISDGLAKGEKTQYQEIKIGESPKGREVKARDASQHMSNILDDYARYVDYIRQAEESEARYGERESYYERESKNYAKRVKEKIAKIEKFDYAW
tara:strand:+ start:4506 stop:6398 length:1893 start_codon:yes stop_codon:yes gene_type:complete